MTKTNTPNATQPRVKCDGDHGGPRCADPECWNDSPTQPAMELTDEQAEHLIENSDGRWVDCEFRIDGPDLMKLLRAACRTSASSAALRSLLDERDALMAALNDAAASLETISRDAGRVDVLECMYQVRPYAANRAIAARAALKDTK